jgi:RNA-directed DNA polymerase
MEEPYVEGVAIRDGPESCVAAREGSGEALTGVRAGRVLSREIPLTGVPTLLTEAEGNIARSAIASCWRTPRGRRPRACAEISVRENREVPCPPAWVIAGRAAQGTLRRYA